MRRLLIWVLFLGLLPACSEGESTVPAETAAAAGGPADAAPLVTPSNGVVFRWSDDTWMMRVNIAIENRGSAPIMVMRDALVGRAVSHWEPLSTFPESTPATPGQTVEGEMAWWTHAVSVPPNVTVLFGAWFQAVPLMEVPLPPAPGTPAVAVTGEVSATFIGPATRWRYPSDQSHMVRASVSVTNGTNIPLSIPASFFGATVGSTSGTYWGEYSTITDPLVLQPGASGEGVVSWYWASDAPVPTVITARLGAPAQPVVTQTLAVTPGDAPG